MYLLDSSYIEARFFMLMSALGSPCVPRQIAVGEKILFATGQDLEDWNHDENLLKQTLVGIDSAEALEEIARIKSRFRTQILRDAAQLQIARFFGS